MTVPVFACFRRQLAIGTPLMFATFGSEEEKDREYWYPHKMRSFIRIDDCRLLIADWRLPISDWAIDNNRQSAIGNRLIA